MRTSWNSTYNMKIGGKLMQGYVSRILWRIPKMQSPRKFLTLKGFCVDLVARRGLPPSPHNLHVLTKYYQPKLPGVLITNAFWVINAQK